jgi:hypothetical protein
MDYKKGDTVVVNVYGKNKIGLVAEKTRTTKGSKYFVNTEDGREHEDVYVDSNESTTFIDSNLTKSFVNHQNREAKLIDDVIDIVNNS